MRGRIVVGAVAAVVLAIVLAWTLTDGPPRPRLVPTSTTAGAERGPTPVVATVYRPAFLPVGFQLVGERGGPAGQIAGPSATATPVPVGRAYLLHYERVRADGASDSLDVLTVERPEDPADATTTTATRFTEAQTTVVQVRGHEALIVTTTLAGPVRTLTWTEAPGLQLRIVSTGEITVDELRQIAESLQAD